MASDVLASGWAKFLGGDRKQFDMFFDKMLDGFAYHKIVVDKVGKPVDYVFLEVNHAFENMTGLKRERIIGKRVTEVLPGFEEDPADLIVVYGQVALTGEPVQFENHVGLSDKWYKVSAYCPEKGYFVALLEDITESKQLESEIEILSKFPSENPNPVFRIDGNGIFLYCNLAGASFLAAWNGKVGEHAPKHISQVVADVLASDKRVEVEETFGAKTFSLLFVPFILEGYVNIYGNDITERKKAEEALKESEHLYRTVFDNSQDGFQLIELIYDKNGKPHDYRFLRVNSAYEKIMGVKAKDVTGKTARRISPNCEAYWFEVPERVSKTGRSEHVELYNKDINKYLDCYYFPYSENIVGTLFRDVTGVKKAEAAVQAEKKRFFDVLETLPTMIRLITPDYHVVFANRSFREKFGESNGRHCYEYCFGNTEPCKFCESYTVLKTGKPHHWEFTGPDGSAIEAYDFPFTDVDGLPLILEMDIDITQRKKAEQQLRAVSLYARSLLEASLDPLVTINSKGKITDVNKATEEATGSTREELIGSDFSDYFTEPEEARKGYRQVFTEGFVKDYPLAIRHKSGKVMDVLYNASIYRNPQGEIQGVFAAARDITDRKAMENEIKQTMEKLQQSNAELEQFAYVASHDLQEPLRMVASYVQLLERRYKGKLDADADEFIAYAVDGANRMRGLIDDLLTYSRVSRLGKPLEPTDLESTLDVVLMNLQALITENSAVVTHDKLPVVMADGGQLVQLLQNLIGNAIKFHGKDPPRVHVSAKSQEKDYLFSVQDNGIGIAPEYFDRLFKIFQRLHTREEYPGSGIGLAVCKRIVERHGGRIWIESQVGKGSIIYFTLNRKKGS